MQPYCIPFLIRAVVIWAYTLKTIEVKFGAIMLLKATKFAAYTFFLTILISSIVFAQDQLGETYSDSNTPFTFQYPSGWNVEGGGDAVYLTNMGNALASSLTLMSGGNDPLQSGQFLITIFAFPEAESGLDLQNFKKAEALGLVKSFQPFSSADTVITREPESIQTGAHDGLRFDAVTGDLEQLFLIIRIDADNLVFFTATTLKDEMGQYESTVLAIADTLSYAAPLRTGFIEDYGPAAEAGQDGVVWQLQRPTNIFKAEALNSLGEIEIASDDTIYVFDNSVDNIKVISPDGDWIGTIVNQNFSSGIQDMAIASDDTLWMTDSVSRAIYQIDRDGNLLSTIDVGEAGVKPGQFAWGSPDSIAIGADNRAYVFDGQGESGREGEGRVQIYDSKGNFLDVFSLPSSESADYSDEVILAVDHLGNLYTANYTDEISVFSPSGELLKRIELQPDGYNRISIYDFKVLDDEVYVAAAHDTVYKFSLEGELLAHFGVSHGSDLTHAFKMGEFDEIRGVGILSNGDVIANSANLNYAQVVRFQFDN
jgi:sugar lactone lactonase YvrE